MPRKSLPAPPARRRAATRRPRASPITRQAAGSGADTDAAWQVPLGLATVWTQFAQQMQRASEQAWQGLRHDAELEAEGVQRAETAQQLAGVPIGMAAEQLAGWAQWSTQLAASLLDVQAAWLKEFESVASQMLSPLFSRDGRIAFASAQDIVEPPAPDDPMQALRSAQKLWSESAKVWLNAMSHDLQSDSARAG
ncbi:MAG TPA: hypothetical protein VML58_15655 [Burkholderiaceae bacterium]|nr:hypothetical protein [Burkholderiaceae bacterium]